MTDYDLDHFAKRVILDAMNEATKAYWLRRAQTFVGVGTPTCDEIATACRNRAALCEPDDAAIDLDNVWSELAA